MTNLAALPQTPSGFDQLHAMLEGGFRVPIGETLGRLDTAIRPDLSHPTILTPGGSPREYQETRVLTFAARGDQ